MIMFPVIQIGSLSIQSAGLFLLAGFYFALVVTDKAARAAGLDAGKVENTILFSCLAGLAGARLGFLMQNPDVFRNNWVSIVSPNASLLDLSSGFLFALVTGAILLRKYQLPAYKFMDAIAWGVVLQAIGVLLSNLASGGDLGTMTDAAWGVQIAGQIRHPVQAYEIILIVILGWICWQVLVRKRATLPDGVVFFLVTSIIAISLLSMHIFHESASWILNMRAQQLTYLAALIFSLLFMECLFTRQASGMKGLTTINENDG